MPLTVLEEQGAPSRCFDDFHRTDARREISVCRVFAVAGYERGEGLHLGGARLSRRVAAAQGCAAAGADRARARACEEQRASGVHGTLSTARTASMNARTSAGSF